MKLYLMLILFLGLKRALMMIVMCLLKSADIDEIFDQLIKKHEDLKNIDLVLKGAESITYIFIKIIIKKHIY